LSAHWVAGCPRFINLTFRYRAQVWSKRKLVVVEPSMSALGTDTLCSRAESPSDADRSLAVERVKEPSRTQCGSAWNTAGLLQLMRAQSQLIWAEAALASHSIWAGIGDECELRRG
jgi:hypothetical protein